MPLTPMLYAEWKTAALQGKAPGEDVLLYKECGLPEMKVLEEGTRRIRIRMSTASVDRDNDTISVEGWETRNYEKNPVVLYGHNYWGLPVAKAVELHRDSMSLSAIDEFVPREVDQFAGTVYDMLRLGFLNASSVGFRQLEYRINEERRGIDFTRQELLEHSIVPVPANPEALIEARSALGADAMRPLIEWCERTLDTWQKAMAAPVQREAVEGAHGVLSPVLVSVPATPSVADIASEVIRQIEDRYTLTPKTAEPEPDPLLAWLEAQTHHVTPDPFDDLLTGVRTALPTVIREAVQTEMIALTGRLPD